MPHLTTLTIYIRLYVVKGNNEGEEDEMGGACSTNEGEEERV
jgi:hypothetical protein